MVKDPKFFDFEFLIPPTYSTAKYVFFFFIFVAIAIAVFLCAVSKINVFVYL